MYITAGFYYGIALLNAGVGIYVLTKKPASQTHRIFFVFALGIAGWILGLGLLIATQKFIFVAPTLWSGEIVVLALVLFSEYFPVSRSRHISPFALMVPWLVLFAATPFHWFIRTVALNEHGYLEPKNGSLFWTFALCMAIYIVLAGYNLRLSWRENHGIHRIQLFYFLAGGGVFVAVAFLFDVLLPAFGIFSFNLLGPACSVVFIACTAYAMVRHQFLEAQIIIKRSVVYGASIIAVAALFFALEFGIEKFYYNDEVVDIISSAIGAFAFLWFKDFFEVVTDKFFFRADYEYSNAIRELGPLLGTTIATEELTALIANFLSRIIKPRTVIFYVNTGATWFTYTAHAESQLCASMLPHLVPLPPHIILLQEMEVERGSDSVIKIPEQIFSCMRRESIAAIVPFFPMSTGGEANAFLFVGEKLSGDILRPKDIELLSVLAHQGGMAIENARLYETIRRHNEELEDIVEIRTKEIKNVYRSQEEFMANVSHQLQTPIAILQGNLELAGKHSDLQAKQSLKVMSGTLDDMARLVADFLEIAKLNFSKNKFYKDRFDVGTLVAESCEDCLILAETKGVSLTDTVQCISVIGDRKKLKEVILNLLSNALKHTGSGGSITVDVAERNNSVEIAVRDTGSGIDPENISHLFERFYRIPGAGSHGSGLGLHICREIVELHGGTIFAQSTLRKGSLFVIRLPLAKEPDVVASGIL